MTAGGAYTDFQLTGQSGPAGVRFDENDWYLGWVIGGGIEHAVTDNFRLRLDYLYTDYSAKDFGCLPGCQPEVDPGSEHEVQTRMRSGPSTGSNRISRNTVGRGLLPGFFVDAPGRALVFFRHRVKPVITPRMAARDACYCQQASPPHSMFFNGLSRIVRTCRQVSARSTGDGG